MGVLRDVGHEVVDSTLKHGNQDHLPDGTGSHMTLFKLRAQSPPTYGTLAMMARDYTKARSQNEGGDGTITWADILLEEVFEAMAESDFRKLESELIQVAAVAVKWAAAVRGRR